MQPLRTVGYVTKVNSVPLPVNAPDRDRESTLVGLASPRKKAAHQTETGRCFGTERGCDRCVRRNLWNGRKANPNRSETRPQWVDSDRRGVLVLRSFRWVAGKHCNWARNVGTTRTLIRGTRTAAASSTPPPPRHHPATPHDWNQHPDDCHLARPRSSPNRPWSNSTLIKSLGFIT